MKPEQFGKDLFPFINRLVNIIIALPVLIVLC